MDAGRLTLTGAAFDLPRLVEGVVRGLSTQAATKGLELACSIAHDLPLEVQGDPVRVRQVLTILLGNAVKFTEQGRVVLRATTPAQSPEATTIRFEVEDTGIGVSAADQARFLDAAVPSDGMPTRTHGETGLGRCMSRQIVTSMGGRIGVQRATGRGSTFWVELSFQVREGVAGFDLPAAVQNRRALVVDDDEESRRILKEELEGCGMSCGVAASGAEALEELMAARDSGQRYGLVLLDRQMPEMDGLELARRIRNSPRIADTPLLLLTFLDDAPDLGTEFPHGVLRKPVFRATLREHLLRLTQAPRPAARAPEAWPRRLLAAEDNEINQELLRGLLEELGYSLDIVPNGRAAVEAVARGDYAAVLMDGEMPEMDGNEATRAIRQAEAGKRRIPIIAVTAHALPEERDEAFAAGVDDYLTKPFQIPQLLAVLERWVGEATPGSPGGGRRAEPPLADDGPETPPLEECA